MPLMRIPYTAPLPPPTIIPPSARTTSGAVSALTDFLDHEFGQRRAALTRSAGHSQPQYQSQSPSRQNDDDGVKKTLLLTGAGISVASGLADYRGVNGTYTLNKTYRPIYYHEFVKSHEARKRYWARSFLGWTNLERARPNRAHEAVGRLGELGRVGRVVTQNVDSFHPIAHPSLPTIELHGYLRSLVCLSCRTEYPRSTFQQQLAQLNPAWSDFLQEMLRTGALDTENPDERRRKGYRTNPDGDVDIPDAPYSTFRYPACPTCLASPPLAPDGTKLDAEIDDDGAWRRGSGILKPAVIMFGESISAAVKTAAEEAVDEAGRVLVIGSSLATYSAWRLVKRAKERGLPIGILNMGGVRGEEGFFEGVAPENTGVAAVRCSEVAEKVLPVVVGAIEELEGLKRGSGSGGGGVAASGTL
ncbi:DHS-like NAD/FAD-binding domain-containing protein [Aulographum hederae CBS 113979]|uniref:DHS-like NAD/FAD-binding domain-containing protein n=1 Tax=Aulographum hederae CBS 113979 TaxID=1176131 RepID=A0A6G1HG33_9PEZI|nr:DHS-like NAD/FAD-binding domain-containing protein [Aulographum hederae CBS 113979]